MSNVTFHQDLEGRKAGETVDSTELNPERLEWLVGNGYVSTDESRAVDHGTQQTDVTADLDPRNPANAAASPVEPHRDELNAPPALENTGQNPPEAFHPDSRTVAQVKDYLDKMPEGAGRDAEIARVKAVEAKGQNRDGIAKL